MKGIAATVGQGGRRDFFWLAGGFSMTASSPVRGLGFNLNLGGIFTSVPAAAASMVRAVGGVHPGGGTLLGNERAERAFSETAGVSSETGAAGGETGASGRAGGAVMHGHLDDLIPRIQQVDLFGLGLDYAMYHKALRGDYDDHDLGPWHRLGGEFTSAPAAIAWAGSRVDVFGVGLDHALYTRTRRGDIWTPDWQSLGGAFTSAASLVSNGPNQLHVFARGADFTLRRNQNDGSAWFGWQNLGGNLASPPVVVSWGPDRLDVFAIFKDGALWHRWWDGQIWNDWESLGGSYTGEPAAASWEPGRLDVFIVGAADRKLHYYTFSGNTWSLPRPLDDESVTESATVISTAPNRLEIFAPSNGDLRRRTWDGQAWQVGAAGAGIRLPSLYRLSVDHIRVETTRALNSDTDGAMASVSVGNRPVQIKTQWIGDLGGLADPKETQTNLLDFEPVSIDLAEAMSFAYLVVNNGHAPKDKILAALANAGDSLSLATVSSMEEDIAKGIVKFLSVKLAAAITVPVLGPITNLIEGWLLEKLSDAIFESCDGVVATELLAMMGRDLFIMTDNGNKTVKVTTTHHGTSSPTACGANSEYKVTWSIKPL